jgi:YidC/Oxa1 family membrane protein insertase
MDRKSYLILFISFLLFLAWNIMLPKMFPPQPLPPTTNAITHASISNRPSMTNAAAPAAVPQMRAENRFSGLEKQQESLLVIENDDARYTFTSLGGGIKQIDLKKYPEVVGQGKKSAAATNLATLNTKVALPVLALLSPASLEGDGPFTLTKTVGGVRAEKRLTNGITLVKEFHLSTNYLVEASARIENNSGKPLAIPAMEWNVGTATPLGATDKNTVMMGLITYNGSKAEYVGDSWFANRTLGCLPGTPRNEYASGTNIAWAAVHNQFFAIALISTNEPALRVLAHKVDLPAPTAAELADDSRLVAKPYGFQAAMVFPEMTLAANQTLEKKFTIYAGPKEYNSLARIGVAMKNDLDLIMDFSGFFGFFAKLLLISMNGLHAMHLGYGMAIIVITILIKLLFWPLTNASTRSMKRMAALQPQMNEIKEKYKDDPKKVNQKTMEFMKEHKVNPASGCFPMLLQIPVFFGFYKMLQGAIELRGASFLWVKDLSVGDTIYTIPGVNFPVNPLPLLMGVTMLWQARMTPASPNMDPMQQKIMKYMPLMFMVFLYNFSAGLTLYWTVQNLLTIAQMKLTKNQDVTIEPPRKHRAPTPGAFGSRKSKS